MSRTVRIWLIHALLATAVLRPVEPAHAQWIAPSGVHRLAAIPIEGASSTDTCPPRERSRGQRVAHSALVGAGVGAVVGAGVFSALYVATALSSETAVAPDRRLVLVALTAFTGAFSVAGAVIGTVTGLVPRH